MDSVELEFGLERANSVDNIEVLWPSGRRQVIENVGANQIVEIVEPTQ